MDGARGLKLHTARDNHCGKVSNGKVKSNGICVSIKGAGQFGSAKLTNPLNNRGECVDSTECSEVVVPNQAVVNGETTFDIASMSADQVDELESMAQNDTAVSELPQELLAFIIPTEEEPEITDFSTIEVPS